MTKFRKYTKNSVLICCISITSMFFLQQIISPSTTLHYIINCIYNINTPIKKVYQQTNNKPTNITHSVIQNKMYKIEKRMKKRIAHMNKICANNGLNENFQKPNPWEYIINTKYKLIWCNVFKSSSTSWMYIFNILAGYNPTFLNKTKQVPLQLARNVYGRPTMDSIKTLMKDQNTISFLVARNPLQRLVSAYTDKICNSHYHSKYDYLRRNITNLYGRNKIPLSYNTKYLPQKFIPTFQNFVKYILNEVKASKELDMHWTPVYKFCTPCQFSLNTLIYYETIKDDSNYVLHKNGIYNITGMLPIKNKSKKLNTSYKHYVAQLPKDSFQDILKLYELDFMLFNYKMPYYEDFIPFRKI